jgi:hypothetical protein
VWDRNHSRARLFILPPLLGQVIRLGWTIISFTSTSAGCSVANAIARAMGSGGIASLSIELLHRPTLLDRLAGLPIRVPFHSIIGDRGLGGGPQSSDGVVPYSSSHLAGAESEKIVPAGHTVFSNDAAVLELKRILEENLKRPPIVRSSTAGIPRARLL